MKIKPQTPSPQAPLMNILALTDSAKKRRQENRRIVDIVRVILGMPRLYESDGRAIPRDTERYAIEEYHGGFEWEDSEPDLGSLFVHDFNPVRRTPESLKKDRRAVLERRASR